MRNTFLYETGCQVGSGDKVKLAFLELWIRRTKDVLLDIVHERLPRNGFRGLFQSQ
jgi:hypothetical protein